MIIANDEIPKMTTNGQQVIKKRYFTSLPLNDQCLNFKANIGISDTSTTTAKDATSDGILR